MRFRRLLRPHLQTEFARRLYDSLGEPSIFYHLSMPLWLRPACICFVLATQRATRLVAAGLRSLASAAAMMLRTCRAAAKATLMTLACALAFCLVSVLRELQVRQVALCSCFRPMPGI